mmetsp:Transcript_24110/g.62110  ORF Transcript_24110/g.62110 Transcript_24110/m.62110 type:complete len:257 (+) Transcript_24110:426-1196(+)
MRAAGAEPPGRERASLRAQGRVHERAGRLGGRPGPLRLRQGAARRARERVRPVQDTRQVRERLEALAARALRRLPRDRYRERAADDAAQPAARDGLRPEHGARVRAAGQAATGDTGAARSAARLRHQRGEARDPRAAAWRRDKHRDQHCGHQRRGEWLDRALPEGAEGGRAHRARSTCARATTLRSCAAPTCCSARARTSAGRPTAACPCCCRRASASRWTCCTRSCARRSSRLRTCTTRWWSPSCPSTWSRSRPS